MIHYLGVRMHPRSQPLNQIWTADIDWDDHDVNRNADKRGPQVSDLGPRPRVKHTCTVKRVHPSVIEKDG